MKHLTLIACLLLALSIGCSGLSMRSQSPEEPTIVQAEQRKLIGDVAVPFGMFPIRIEAIGLVTGLPGTGSDPPVSPERSKLLSEMQQRGVQNPNQVLASPTTDLVLVRGYLRPGIQKGDRFDLEVRVPTRSENTGLRGGWLMETRLTQMAAIGGELKTGAQAGMAQGPILVDPTVDAKNNKVLLSRGRVLGGAVSQISRPLGLALKPAHRNIGISALVGMAVNKRFHTFDKGIKVGVANPKTDQFVELKVHPRYKDNIERFMRVVRAVPIKETPSEQLARLQVLERNLLDPITSASAALKLEAIGKEAVPVLKKGMSSGDVEVRFYSAEALAYLDDKEAAAPLGEIARNEPAFRAFALAALGAMDDFEAFEALRELLAVQSAETRYGAFRALWWMNKNDPLVRDERITDQFHYHLLKSGGPPMIHFTRNGRPEVVLFGEDQKFIPPVSLEAGPRIMINSTDSEHIAVSRYAPGEPDQKRIVSTSIDEVVRAVADMGGTYPDVVQCLQQAKSAKALPGRLEIEAIPQAGREYERDSKPLDADEAADPSADGVADEEALDPSLAGEGLTNDESRVEVDSNDSEDSETDENDDSKAEKPSLWNRIRGKVTGKG